MCSCTNLLFLVLNGNCWALRHRQAFLPVSRKQSLVHVHTEMLSCPGCSKQKTKTNHWACPVRTGNQLKLYYCNTAIHPYPFSVHIREVWLYCISYLYRVYLVPLVQVTSQIADSGSRYCAPFFPFPDTLLSSRFTLALTWKFTFDICLHLRSGWLGATVITHILQIEITRARCN